MTICLNLDFIKSGKILFLAGILDAILGFSARTTHRKIMPAVSDTTDLGEHFGV
jgi:hypothetical protein